MNKLLILFVMLTYSSSLYSQSLSSKESDLKMKEYIKVINLFKASIDRTALNDTNQMILFSLKINVKKEGKFYSVSAVEVSDPIAYKIFKKFDFLQDLNFGIFLDRRKQATIILPVAIALVHPEKPNPGMVNAEDVLRGFVPYLFLHDKKGNMAGVYDYIYIPAVTIITTTNEDVKKIN